MSSTNPKQQLLLVLPSFFICFSAFTQDLSVTTKIIGYPRVCKGESNYTVTFVVPTGVEVKPNYGTVRNDTIFNVSSPNYLLVLTLKNQQNEQKTVEVPLPIIDPIIPKQPLVAQQVLCPDSPLPLLKAIVPTQGATANWYNSAKKLVATNTLNYQPTTDDVYYVESYINDSGCASGQISVPVVRPRAICVVVLSKKIKTL